MRRWAWFCWALACVFAMLVTQAVAEEFPARKDYPTVKTISTDELWADFQAGKVVIVDVRSTIEFNAIHVPISNKTFISEVGGLIAKNPGKKLAFYCNGVTCLKSYEAAQRSQESGYADCFAYDAGIPDWANRHPAQTLLLGKVLVNPQAQLISDDAFHGKLLEFDTFLKRSQTENGIVIDTRDFIQSSGNLPGLEAARKIPLDTFLENFVSKKLNQDKPLFIFDQVGKQVRWLEYYLIDNGYAKYYFLKGGATAVLKDQTYK